MKYLLSTLLLSLLTNSILAQETHEAKKDSIKRNRLEEVVLTGQYNTQSVNKSVFEVEVLNQEDIQLLAGNNLGDVLNQTLNMNIVPQAGEGRSGIQQFGFNSEYVKILVDNIPMIGDEGFGNAIDVTQINLDDIEQIEIIEGSMGVQYGANAVTGVINIITKKSSKYKWQITPYIQEETINDEYGWFDEGRHIQSLKVGHNFSDKIYANVLYTRNDFQGFLNDHQGKDYYNTEDANDGLRGYEWLPKEQNTLKALLNYHNKNFRFFYKFEYFTEETEKYGINVLLNANPATKTYNPTSNDRLFSSERFYHHLNASGKIKNQINFNISASYQEQTKNLEDYTYVIKSGNKQNIDEYDYNKREGIFSRGTFSNFFNNSKFNFEAGYEINLDDGSASGLSSQNKDTRTQTNSLDSYSFFVSSEIVPTNRLSLRPGVRGLFSPQFSTEYALSLSAKYSFNKGYQLRAVIGSTPKLPNFEQMYFYLVDSNHNVQGNANLNPEYGKSIFLYFKKNFWLANDQLRYTPKISMGYLDVKDKIDLLVVNPSPLTYRYKNIDNYRTWNFAFRNTLNYKNLSAGAGVAVSGESKILKSAENYNDDYLYAVQINTNLSYRVPKWDTTFSAFFKLNGPQYQFVYDIEDPDIIRRSKLDGYSWLNTSVRKVFLENIEVTLGARNVLDVTRVNFSNGQASGHSEAASSQLLGYGRSYFFKLLYNLNF